MAISKAKKEEVINSVKAIAKDSETVVFANFHGLPVSLEQEMRRTLKESDVRYTVAKKQLVKKALEDTNVEGELPTLEGELALAYGSDPVAPARELNEFVKKANGGLSILGGIFEGKFATQSEMQTIAQIPPLGTLHAQIAHLIRSPIQGLVIGLSAVADKKEA